MTKCFKQTCLGNILQNHIILDKTLLPKWQYAPQTTFY